MMSGLIQRTRTMMDEIGVERGRPILLAVRTPDSLEYCKALGLDLEQWMRDNLIDIWVATGYFRLQEWEETVKIGHQYGVQVWASPDESRLSARGEGYNSPEVYRARAMNAWNAGVDSIYLFNFFYKPDKPQFKLLYELGDPVRLAYLNKTYLADVRGGGALVDRTDWLHTDLANPGYWLNGGERFFTRPMVFSPTTPLPLRQGKSQIVNLLVGDDLGSAQSEGTMPEVTLSIEAQGLTGTDHLLVKFNDKVLKDGILSGQWLKYGLTPELVKLGSNRIRITLAVSKLEPILRDLQLSIRYESSKKPACNSRMEENS